MAKVDSAWMIHRERCRLEQEHPPDDGQTVAIGDVISQLCARIENDSDFAVLRRIQEVWLDLAGSTLAAHAWPACFDTRVLTVCVENNIWLSEVSRMYAGRLLRDIANLLGDGVVRRIRLRVDAGVVRDNAPV